MAEGQQVLSLETLAKIDGLSDAFEDSIKRCVADCRSRPGLSTFREVEIKIRIKPGESDDNRVTFKAEAKHKIPVERIDEYEMLATPNDGLKFNPSSPHDPLQQTLDFDGEDPPDFDTGHDDLDD